MSLPIQSKDAQLPANYEHAKKALAECSRVDECKAWADKATALASYAKQANDDELLHMSNRIKARAVRRMGELFNALPAQQGQASPRGNAGKEAGVSKEMRLQSQAVAGIPEPEFESRIEAAPPATVYQLSGKQERNLRASTSLLGNLKRFAAFCEDNNVGGINDSLKDHERAAAMAHAKTIIQWLTDLANAIHE